MPNQSIAGRPVAGVSRTSAPAGTSVPRRSIWSHLMVGQWLAPTLAFLVIAAIWQMLALGNPYVLPTIDAIGASLAKDPYMYWANFLVTGQEILVGAGIGISAGFILAILMAEMPLVERALMPLMVVIMVTPVVAIAPALVVAFGFGMTPKYIVTALVVFFPMLVNSLAGFKDLDEKALDVMTTLHASRWEIFRDLRLPGSLPFFFAGLRIALPLSVVGAAVAEFAAAGQQAGLGSLLTIAAAQANLPVTWACIVLLCVTGLILVSGLALVRKRILWWSAEDITGR